MFMSLIEIPLSSFTRWNPVTSSRTQIKCLTGGSSNYLLSPIELMTSVFIGPSRTPSCPFSYPEWHTSFIPQSSQFKFTTFFNPSVLLLSLLSQLTHWKTSCLLGVNSTTLYPSTSNISMSSLPLSHKAVSPSKSYTCVLSCFPFLTWDFALFLFHTFNILFSTVSFLSSYSLLVLLLFILKNSAFQYFCLFQTTATWLIACFLFDE